MREIQRAFDSHADSFECDGADKPALPVTVISVALGHVALGKPSASVSWPTKACPALVIDKNRIDEDASPAPCFRSQAKVGLRSICVEAIGVEKAHGIERRTFYVHAEPTPGGNRREEPCTRFGDQPSHVVGRDVRRPKVG